MLGVRSGAGAADDDDPVNREQARVQAVVAYCAPQDLTGAFNDFAVSAVAAFMGMLRPPDPASAEFRMYRQASPIASVSSDDAPILLIHGDQDVLVPIEHSEKMEAALRAANVPVKLIRVTGSGHAIFPKPGYPDFTTEMIRWFDVHLRK
jgi:dipeptidyl aminopeptidase/acylaminoacyl peptidase